MNEIIATVTAGLPYTLLVLVCIVLSLLYELLQKDLRTHGKDWLATFMIAISLFLLLSFISYILGGLI